LALAFALLFGAVVPLQRQAPALRAAGLEDRVLLLPPPGALRVASLGFHGMAADAVWLLTIQYIGTHLTSDRSFPELKRLVESVIALDPHFVDAYTLGGLFLNYSAGDVAGAISLLERGARANPTRWEIPHDLARTYYLDLKDYRQALHWFQVTDRLPGRPHYVPRFVARLYAETGERETALELWRAMRDTATSDWVREIAEREIAKLEGQPEPGAPGREADRPDHHPSIPPTGGGAPAR
jgi:tetratricopeptide (TPR) repeat protein